jgi:hypothetical protein
MDDVPVAKTVALQEPQRREACRVVSSDGREDVQTVLDHVQIVVIVDIFFPGGDIVNVVEGGPGVRRCNSNSMALYCSMPVIEPASKQGMLRGTGVRHCTGNSMALYCGMPVIEPAIKQGMLASRLRGPPLRHLAMQKLTSSARQMRQIVAPINAQ